MKKITTCLGFAFTAAAVACSGENAPFVPALSIDTSPPTGMSVEATAPPTPAPVGDDSSDAGTPPADDAGDTDAGETDAADDAGDNDAGTIEPADGGDAGTEDAGTGAIAFFPVRAVLAGSGCSDSSARVSASASGIRVAFTEMKIELRGGSALSDRRACSVRIPVEIPRGYYISRIDQKLDYSITRSASARATLSTNATLFGLPSSPYTINHQGVSSETLTHAAARNPVRFAAASSEANAMCSPTRPTAGLLALNLAITAQRTATQSVAVAIDQFDYQQGVDVAIAPCP